MVRQLTAAMVTERQIEGWGRSVGEDRGRSWARQKRFGGGEKGPLGMSNSYDIPFPLI